MNGVLFSDLCQPMNSGKIQTCCYITRTAETLTLSKLWTFFLAGRWEGDKSTTCNFVVDSLFYVFVHRLFRKLLCFRLVCPLLNWPVPTTFVVIFFLRIEFSFLPLQLSAATSSKSGSCSGSPCKQKSYESLRKRVADVILLPFTQTRIWQYLLGAYYVSGDFFRPRGCKPEWNSPSQKHAQKLQRQLDCWVNTRMPLRLFRQLLFSIPLPCH